MSHVDFLWSGQQVRDEIEARITKDMLTMADLVVTRAKEFAPKRTGYLAGTIGYHWDAAEMKVVWTVGAPYGIFQEYGTRNMPPHPFMAPAINSVGAIYGIHTELGFLNTPVYNQPVLAVGSRFAMPPTLNERQRAQVRSNEERRKRYYQEHKGWHSNIRHTRLRARRTYF